MKLLVVNPLTDGDWNGRLASLGRVSFFNTAEWARVLSATYGYDPCYLLGIEGGKSVSLLPMMHVSSRITGRRGVSLPFSDYCEPIGLEANRSGGVIDFLKEVGRKKHWRYIEIRDAAGLAAEVPRYANYLKHTLKLADGEPRLMSRLESSVRTSIRKARKEGVEVTFSNTLDAVREFYTLNCITRRRHGLPPQPFDFFAHLQQHVLANGLGTVVTAWYAGAAISASIFCHAGKNALYKYGASDQRYQNLRGSTLVMWEAIRHYVEKGYEQLSLGRTDETQDGLRRFKLGWGVEETTVAYFRYDLRRGGFVAGPSPRSEPGYGFLRMLPLSCLRRIGSMLYKHIA